jgi:hypothetical protein
MDKFDMAGAGVVCQLMAKVGARVLVLARAERVKDLCMVEDSRVSSALLLSDGAVFGWDHGPFLA